MIKRKARIPHLCHEIPRTGDRRPVSRSLFHRPRGRKAPAPVSPGADSAVLLSLFCSSCPFRALLMGGAFPGAAPRVPHGLPRAIPGRPFGAAGTGAQCRRVGAGHRNPRVGAAPRGCPPVQTGTRSRAGDGVAAGQDFSRRTSYPCLVLDLPFSSTEPMGRASKTRSTI